MRNAEGIVRALLLSDAKSHADELSYQELLDSDDEGQLLADQIALTAILLKLAARARGVTENELMCSLLVTASNLAENKKGSE